MGDAPNSNSKPPQVGVRSKGPHRSKLVWLFACVALAGLAMWGYARSTAPRGSGSIPSGVAGLDAGGAAGMPTTPADDRLVARAAPAVSRLGFSFVAGYLLAYGLRAFLKVTALVSLLIVGGAYALHRFGVVDLDPAGVREAVERGMAWAKGEASAVREFLLGYIPSGAALAAGSFFGFRRG